MESISARRRRIFALLRLVRNSMTTVCSIMLCVVIRCPLVAVRRLAPQYSMKVVPAGVCMDLCLRSSSSTGVVRRFEEALRDSVRVSGLPLALRQGGACIELFSGHNGLLAALSARGVWVLVGFESKLSVACDLSRPAVQRVLFGWLMKGGICYVHLGTPCKMNSVPGYAWKLD